MEYQQFDPADIEKNKIYAALAYLGFLFFLPLVCCPESPYGKFHANQGLMQCFLLLASSLINVIPFVGWVVALVGYAAYFVFLVLGIISALNGESKPLPLIGGFQIIK